MLSCLWAYLVGKVPRYLICRFIDWSLVGGYLDSGRHVHVHVCVRVYTQLLTDVLV